MLMMGWFHQNELIVGEAQTLRYFKYVKKKCNN